jgi:peptidoglycan hydrolase-like protein with peptidoglycan-binding domain
VKVLQQRLIEVGYLIPGDDGRFGPGTQNAVLAFQKWERLGRTGLLDATTRARLATAKHPVPLSHGGAGRRAEILLDKQVALLINKDKVVRTIAVSSGKPSTPTPPGATASTQRSPAGGRRRSANGCRGHFRLSAASPFTSSQTCRSSPRHMDACGKP